jgi:hypothetical protein
MKFKVGDKVRFANRVQNSVEPMIVKKVDGKDIYVDWDHRPWLEGNLILDSEWSPTIERLALENALPQVEKGIPAPPKKPDQRRSGSRANGQRS